MLGTYQWYLIYFSFTFTVAIVLLFGAQMKTLAKEFSVPANYFNVVLVLFPLGNGLSRVVSGAISDRVGRENTGNTMRSKYRQTFEPVLAYIPGATC